MAPVRSSNGCGFVILMGIAIGLKQILPEKLEFIAMGLGAIAVLVLIAGVFGAFADMFRK
jgi:hypothetical protein